jgi:hypothetical protein
MPWIDSSIPQSPLLVLDPKTAAGANSIDIYFREAEPNDMINRYVIYQFKNPNSTDKEDPKNIKEIINSGNNFYTFDLQTVPADQNRIAIAATSLTSTNNESELSKMIILQRNANGWQIVNQ